jgi:hypothetical protein
MASSYGWAAVVLGILLILGALLYALRAMRNRAVDAARTEAALIGADQVGRASEAARKIEGAGAKRREGIGADRPDSPLIRVRGDRGAGDQTPPA